MPDQRPDQISRAPEPRFVEVVDSQDRPLAVLSLHAARRQRLPHRTVAAFVHTRDGKVYLPMRGPGKRLYPDHYDISLAGPVGVGTSRKETILNLLALHVTGHGRERLTLKQSVPASQTPTNTQHSLYQVGPVDAKHILPQRAAQSLLVSQSELTYLMERFRETFTPRLVEAWELGIIFAQ